MVWQQVGSMTIGGLEMPMLMRYFVPGPLGISIGKRADTQHCEVQKIHLTPLDGYGFELGDVLIRVSVVYHDGDWELRTHQDVDTWQRILKAQPQKGRHIWILRAAPGQKVPLPTKAASSSNNKKKRKDPPKSSETERTTEPKKRQKNAIVLPKVTLLERPAPGHVDKDKNYYITKSGETLSQVATKLGCKGGWQTLAKVEENLQSYGLLKSTTAFQRNTALRFPPNQVSAWQCQKLEDKMDEDGDVPPDLDTIACSVCQSTEDVEGNDMLLCDGCNGATHVKCCGLSEVPSGSWFCAQCLEILQARKEHYPDDTTGDADNNPGRSLRASPPPLPPSVNVDARIVKEAQERLKLHLQFMRDKKLRELLEFQQNVAKAAPEQLKRLNRIEQRSVKALKKKKKQVVDTKCSLMQEQGISDFNGDPSHRLWSVEYSSDQQRFTCYDPRNPRFLEGKRRVAIILRGLEPAERAVEEATEAEAAAKKELAAAKSEEKNREKDDKQMQNTLKMKYAAMLEEPRCGFETMTQYRNRQDPPKLLGFCKLGDADDVRAMNMLTEPDQLIFLVSMENTKSASKEDDHKDEDHKIEVGADYAVFGTEDLFDPKRDDNLPMVEGGVRDAQRRLVAILSDDVRNDIIVSEPMTPNSINLRGIGSDETDVAQASKCFDLSELVRDCTCDLDLPKAPTPPRLAAHGLELREHQKSSLQWMLDKENDPTGLGMAGELWTRLRCLSGGCTDYYFCELTGSFAKNIFDFRADLEQSDAANTFGALPCGGLLGDEMGLGKTLVCLSLVVANPPPLHNRVLSREYKWEEKINHPDYVPPPCVLGATASSAKTMFLSNGTVVIAPMTLCSQWKTEIARFAPWMNVITLHTGDNHTLQELASADMIITSTFVVQNNRATQHLFNRLKRIHFHRLIIDEAHNESKNSFATLSATSRFCVTGTPFGSSLSDLGGQLRFLRVSKFCRKKFWKQNICGPYSEQNMHSLNVLRSLLSRLVVRHSKAQISAAGKALLELPPRTVETVLLPFATQEEQKVYDLLETQNMDRFSELRKNGQSEVLSRYTELQGLSFLARQACCHASLLNLAKLNRLNEGIERDRDEKLTMKYGDKNGKKGAMSKDKTRVSVLEEAVWKAKSAAKGRARELVLKFQDGDLFIECAICLDPISEKEAALTPCAHAFCRECICNLLKVVADTRHRKAEAKGSCPHCREQVSLSSLTFLGEANDAGKKKSPTAKKESKKPAAKATRNGAPQKEVHEVVNGFKMLQRQVKLSFADVTTTTKRVDATAFTEDDRRFTRGHYHTISGSFVTNHAKASNMIGSKIQQLLKEIHTMMEKDPTSKCVVFSQFLEVLDIAHAELFARGVELVRVDGSMKQYERADALHAFSANPNVKVFLLSLKAGSAGLNLTAANYCFIMDTPLHSASEEQAIDRIHRIGQTREVMVKRFVMAGTIEERILNARRSMTNSGVAGTTTLAVNDDELGRSSKHTKHTPADNEESSTTHSLEHIHNIETWFGRSISSKSS